MLGILSNFRAGNRLCREEGGIGLKKIFLPSMALMGRLRYAAKFSLIGLQFLLPLAVVMFFFQREINTNIDFARNERDGVAYARPVLQLLHDTLLHEQITNRGCAAQQRCAEPGCP
jgi:hypothetical protein